MGNGEWGMGEVSVPDVSVRREMECLRNRAPPGGAGVQEVLPM